MPHATEQIKAHHRSISQQLRDGVDAVAATDVFEYDSRKTKFDDFVVFLTDDLTPHAEGEERSLYPAVRDLICRYDNPLATMSLDHQAIVDRINRLREIVGQMDAGSYQLRAQLLPEARKIAIELGALVSVHLAKEEIALLPLMEEHMSDDEVRMVVHGMHEE
jgi:hemerythrin-like domain-containing protein